MATKRGNIRILKRTPWHDFNADLDEPYWPLIEMIAEQAGSAVDVLIERMKECEKHMRGCIGVYVAGGTGSDRSATINSLYQLGEIARAGGSLTLNEYCGARPDQTAPFLAEVSFFPPKDQHVVLTELVRDYYGHNFVKEVQAAMALASLFKEHPEWDGISAVPRLFAAAETDDVEAIVTKLKLWSNDLIANITQDKEIVTITASTTADLLRKLEPYAIRTSSSMLPLVSMIRFHFPAPLMKQGVSIVDYPEWLRTDRECWHAIFVTEANSALSDPKLFSGVRQMKDNGTNRVAVVVTNRDSIDERANQRSNAPGDTIKNSEQICQQLRRDLKVPVFVVSHDGHAFRTPTEPIEEDPSITNLRDQVLSFRIQGRLNAERKWLEVEIPSWIELVIATDADRAVAKAEGREVHQISLQRLPALKGSLEALRRSLDARTMQFQEFVASYG